MMKADQETEVTVQTLSEAVQIGGFQMKKGKKILAILLGAALAVTALGCGSTAGENRPGGEGAQTSEPGQEQTFVNPEDTSGSAGESTETGSVTSMGRYMESSLLLPENADTLARTMALLADGKLAYFDQETGLHISEDEGKSWKDNKKPKELIPDREIGYISNAAIAPDASVAVCEMFFTDRKISETKVTCVDAAGTRTETDGMISENEWIARVAFGPDSSLYAASNRGKVFEIDRSAGERRLLFAGTMQPEVIAFTGKLLLALEESGVEIYNLETGALQEADPVLDAFCREKLAGKLGANSDCVGGYLLGAEEGIVYLACREGLFRHVLGGSAMEQLIEGSFSTFGDPTTGMCTVLLLADGDFLLLDVGEEMTRFTYDPNEPTIPEKQLKVYSLKENSRLRQAISVYQKEYPDIYVSYEVGMAEGSAVTRMDALKNLNLSLMGGDGPDVLLLDDIDQTPYAEKGMLKDLSGILEGLAGENAVFENIAGAYRSAQGTFVLPAGFKLPLILGKTEDLDSVTDLKTLADLTERLAVDLNECTVTGAVTAEDELAQLFVVCSPFWLSGRELNEAALKEFLLSAKRMYDADRTGVTTEFAEHFGFIKRSVPISHRSVDMMVGMAKLAFGNAEMMLADMGSISWFLEEEEGYSFRLWSGQGGTGFVPVSKLAVSAQTKRSEEAESFVRLMFSGQVQSAYLGDGFPVNRSSFDSLCEWNEQSIGGGFYGPNGEVMYGYGWPKEETVSRLKELAEQADQCLEGNAVLEEAVLKYGTEVLKGTLTVEEGIQEIKKAVAIYLSEQG